MGKFKKGLFFGGLLGAGMMWLNTTKKGKQLREQMLEHSVEVYINLKKELLASDNCKKLTKNKYIKMVQEYVDKYAVKNELTDNLKKMIVKVVAGQWNQLKEEIKKK